MRGTCASVRQFWTRILAYSCIFLNILHIIAYSCIFLHFLAYSCVLERNRVYSCIFFNTLAYSYIFLRLVAVAWTNPSPSFIIANLFILKHLANWEPDMAIQHSVIDELHTWENVFGSSKPPGQNIFFGGNFYFFYWKKTDFRAFFRLFTASVQSRPTGPPANPGVFGSVNSPYIFI